MLHEKYVELLAEMGIAEALPPQQQDQESLIIRHSCCGPIEADLSMGDIVCTNCGRVLEDHLTVNEEEPTFARFGQPMGLNTSYTQERKQRHYKPLNHFKEHIRRYLGARFTDIPDELIMILREKVDVDDRNCYFVVERELKRLKLARYYKEIFTIIYKLGGHRPNFSKLRELYRLYATFDYFYSREKHKWQRKNALSHYMVLDLLLREVGHEPYYKLKQLKDGQLRTNVMNIFAYIKACSTN